MLTMNRKAIVGFFLVVIGVVFLGENEQMIWNASVNYSKYKN